MSVETTITLTRKEAKQKYDCMHDDIGRLNRPQADLMSDKQLEDEIKRMDDYIHNGQSYCNYLIAEE